jgi:hypothetical protein
VGERFGWKRGDECSTPCTRRLAQRLLHRLGGVGGPAMVVCLNIL